MMVRLVYFFNLKLGKVASMKLALRLTIRPAHLFRSHSRREIAKAHSCLVARLVNFHDQSHDEVAHVIIVAVPVRVLVSIKLLLRDCVSAVGVLRSYVLIVRMPARVRAVVATQSFAHDFDCALLRVNVDSRIDRESALRNARRVTVFKILSYLFNRIIEWRRTSLHWIESSVRELNRFRFRSVRIRLRDETVLSHLV